MDARFRGHDMMGGRKTLIGAILLTALFAHMTIFAQEDNSAGLAQAIVDETALAGTAGFILGNLATVGGEGGESKGLSLGWDPTLSLVIAIVGTVLIGLFFGAIAARSTGIDFLMITLTFSVIGFYFVGQVTVVSGFSGIGGINRYTPGFVGDMVNDRFRLYYIAFGVAVLVYAVIRFIVRTPFGLSLQGVRDEPVRMSSLGYAVPLHRTLAFGLAAFFAALSGVLLVWWQGQIAPGDVGLPATIDLLIVAVIGGLARIEGAWIGAFAFILIGNYVRDSWLTRLLDDLHIGGSFNTIIGLIFLLIVIVSPDGLVGLWDRLWRRIQGGGNSDAPVAPVAPVGAVPREV